MILGYTKFVFYPYCHNMRNTVNSYSVIMMKYYPFEGKEVVLY